MKLDESSFETLRAVVDRIIPTDDFPGAWESGFSEYLDKLLERENQFSSIYEAGLPAMDREAEELHRSRFADLDVSTQDMVLARVERGEVDSDWPIPPQEFFQTLVRHVSESFYADPGNGGNRESTSWRMVGYLPHGNTQP